VWGEDGWPRVNGGRGPSSVAPAPLGRGGPASEPEFFDGFNGAALGPEWQWPMNNAPTIQVEGGRGGHLSLTPSATAVAEEYAGAVVARRTTSGDYTATALVDVRGAAPAARAGLSAYGWRDSALGVSAGGGKVYVWRREGREARRVAVADLPGSDFLYLRMQAQGGERYHFSFSTNGREWTGVGGAVDGAFIEAARVALTAAGGAARFDWVRVTPKQP
jgi:beta-xylosidase